MFLHRLSESQLTKFPCSAGIGLAVYVAVDFSELGVALCDCDSCVFSGFFSGRQVEVKGKAANSCRLSDYQDVLNHIAPEF